jgi:methyl-accepting chemotaxis protein
MRFFIKVVRNMKKWYRDLSIKRKLILCFVLTGVCTVAVGLIGVLSAFNIMETEGFTQLIITAILVLAALAVSFFTFRYFKNKVVAYIVGLTVGIDKLCEGHLAYFDNDMVFDGKSKDETVKQAEAFVRLVVKTREKVADANQIADGDLTTQIHKNSEVDELGCALLELVHNTHNVVSTIVSASDQVASGSNMVASSSFALSQGAATQASSVQELTASLEEVASQTNLNAQNAKRANEYAQNAKVNAATGNEHMKEMLGAMNEINTSSSSIGKVIKVIEDIAFQTNILALNAAVEAARAGQHGKGFAVVAEEVRNLAAKSANAAKETTALIEGSTKKVDAGTKIAAETAEALSRIVAEVEKAASLVSSIAIASDEQAAAIEQINKGINQVSQVVSTNAATAEESAAASEELSSQAAALKEAVGVFKLKRAVKGSALGSADRLSANHAPIRKAEAVSKISLSDGEFGKY